MTLFFGLRATFQFQNVNMFRRIKGGEDLLSINYISSFNVKLDFSPFKILK